MRPYQRLVSKTNGKEIMLFPLEILHITQGEGGSYSHAGTYNMDFVGVTTHAPIYAPCSCTCVDTIAGTNNGRVFESIAPVNLANGTIGFVTFAILHDENPIASIGDVFIQGSLIGHTGQAGQVTGDHVHLNTAYGTYQGVEYVPPDNQQQLVNSSHIYETCYINNTLIVEPLSYTWVTYQNGVSPSMYKGYRFKWVLYARKLRDRFN